MRHMITVWHNTECLKCGRTEKEMVNLQSVVWCNSCFDAEVVEMAIRDDSQEELERIHSKWAQIRIKKLTDQLKTGVENEVSSNDHAGNVALRG